MQFFFLLNFKYAIGHYKVIIDIDGWKRASVRRARAFNCIIDKSWWFSNCSQSRKWQYWIRWCEGVARRVAPRAGRVPRARIPLRLVHRARARASASARDTYCPTRNTSRKQWQTCFVIQFIAQTFLRHAPAGSCIDVYSRFCRLMFVNGTN